jgi:hypothetical protein
VEYEDVPYLDAAGHVDGHHLGLLVHLAP